jgi:uncharacterized protein
MGEGKPQPNPSAESAPYWAAAKERRLVLQHCNACGKCWFPPSRRCAHCLSTDFDWQESRGQGRVYSFVVFHRVYHPAYESEVPYAVAIIELDEGPRLLANIVGTAPEAIRCDERVRVVFEERGEHTIPQFVIAP